jgi:hypothetical protein
VKESGALSVMSLQVGWKFGSESFVLYVYPVGYKYQIRYISKERMSSSLFPAEVLAVTSTLSLSTLRSLHKPIIVVQEKNVPSSRMNSSC